MKLEEGFDLCGGPFYGPLKGIHPDVEGPVDFNFHQAVIEQSTRARAKILQ